MDIEAIHEFVLHLHPQVAATQPFGPDTLVFKIVGKVFMLLSLDEVPTRINLKCEPDRAVELRESYAAIIPGYHMNKKHWNTIIIDGTLQRSFIQEMIRDSYELVVAKLPKKQKEALERS
jgi:predicted DNA-binding protein (MmcQ/YjbR family)